MVKAASISPRTVNLTEKSGCIEDRTFANAQNGELNQVPGADLFFSVYKDVEAVSTKGAPTHSTLEQTVLVDVAEHGQAYTVHNDADHGSEFDGCGFAARLGDIFTDMHENIEDIISGLQLNQEQAKRAYRLAGAAGKLASHETYFDVVGGELVQSAVEAGASLVTYERDHTAGSLTIDASPDSTYDSVRANAENTASFNLDSNHARDRAERSGLNPDDAAIFGQIASLATVRVLSRDENGVPQITHAEYV